MFQKTGWALIHLLALNNFTLQLLFCYKNDIYEIVFYGTLSFHSTKTLKSRGTNHYYDFSGPWDFTLIHIRTSSILYLCSSSRQLCNCLQSLLYNPGTNYTHHRSIILNCNDTFIIDDKAPLQLSSISTDLVKKYTLHP